MSSEQQIEANRRNAQLCTGPRTIEGKARSSSNALKHGLTASRVILRDESEEEFNAFRLQLLDDLDPGSPLEEVLSERIVFDAWRLRRAGAFEKSLFERNRIEEFESEREFEQTEAEKADYARDPSINPDGSPREPWLPPGVNQTPNQPVDLLDYLVHRSLQFMHMRHKTILAERAARGEPTADVPFVQDSRALEKYRPLFAHLEHREAELTRSFFKNLRGLQRLQARRLRGRAGAPAVVEVDESGDG